MPIISFGASRCGLCAGPWRLFTYNRNFDVTQPPVEQSVLLCPRCDLQPAPISVRPERKDRP